MTENVIILTDELQRDPYPDGHPWSVNLEHNTRTNSVSIRQGGMGVRPIYILNDGTNRVIGSRFEELVALAKTLTPCAEGRLELLLFGHTSGTRTLFKEISRLPSGDRHLVCSTGISSEWSDRILDSGTSQLGNVAEVFIEGLRKRIDQEPTGWLPLTGGIDSRTIASVVDGATGIRAYTRGTVKHPEVQRASRVAKLIRMNHYPIPFPSSYLLKNIDSIVALTGGMVSIDHSHAIHPMEHLHRLSRGIVLPGINGEYGRAFWSATEKQTASPAAEDLGLRLFKQALINRKARYANLFTPEAVPLTESLQAEFVARYVDIAEYSRFSHPIAWNDEFYLRERVRSFTSFGGVIWSDTFRIELPFLEADYVQAVRNLSPAFRMGPHLHAEIIRRTSPALLRVPLHPSDRPMNRKLMDPVTTIWRRAVKRLSGSRNRKGAQDYPQWLRDEASFTERFILSAHENACGLVDPGAVRKIWTSHLNGTDHHQILYRLATLSMVDAYVRTKKGSKKNESGNSLHR